jgi:hypothetical protein
MRRRRTLIGSHLEWQMTAASVPPREQNPFDSSRFEAWFSGIERKALKLGDYSVAGLEELCAVERKDLFDLVHSLRLSVLCSSIVSG